MSKRDNNNIHNHRHTRTYGFKSEKSNRETMRKEFLATIFTHNGKVNDVCITKNVKRKEEKNNNYSRRCLMSICCAAILSVLFSRAKSF